MESKRKTCLHVAHALHGALAAVSLKNHCRFEVMFLFKIAQRGRDHEGRRREYAAHRMDAPAAAEREIPEREIPLRGPP